MDFDLLKNSLSLDYQWNKPDGPNGTGRGIYYKFLASDCHTVSVSHPTVSSHWGHDITDLTGGSSLSFVSSLLDSQLRLGARACLSRSCHWRDDPLSPAHQLYVSAALVCGGSAAGSEPHCTPTEPAGARRHPSSLWELSAASWVNRALSPLQPETQSIKQSSPEPRPAPPPPVCRGGPWWWWSVTSRDETCYSSRQLGQGRLLDPHPCSLIQDDVCHPCVRRGECITYHISTQLSPRTAFHCLF